MRILIDTTYILPVFGIDIAIDSPESIARVFSEAIRRGVKLYLSLASVIEAYLKTCRLATKLGIEDLRKDALKGVAIIMRDPNIVKISVFRSAIFREAHRILRVHRDPFDAFIFATARALDMTLLTEDSEAKNFIEKVMSWREFRSMIVG